MQQPHCKRQHFQKRVCGFCTATPLPPPPPRVHICCKGTSGEGYIQIERENVLELFLLKGWLGFFEQKTCPVTKAKIFCKNYLDFARDFNRKVCEVQSGLTCPSVKGGENGQSVQALIMRSKFYIAKKLGKFTFHVSTKTSQNCKMWSPDKIVDLHQANLGLLYISLSGSGVDSTSNYNNNASSPYLLVTIPSHGRVHVAWHVYVWTSFIKK